MKPYIFVEYPKHVTVNGRTFVCQDEAEEAQALETGTLVTEAHERKRLMKVCEVKNVPNVDGRWKLERIEAAIRNAGHDPSLDPFK